MSTVPLQILFHEDGSVKGVATNDVGIHKDGSPKVRIFHIKLRVYCNAETHLYPPTFTCMCLCYFSKPGQICPGSQFHSLSISVNIRVCVCLCA